jgi:microcystin-dependent protein
MQVNFSINIDDKLIERGKKFFTKRNTIVGVLIFTVAVTTVILNGESITNLLKFNDGQIIYADDINANFKALFDKVNELDASRIDVVGAVIPFAGNETKVPAGWLLCDGAEYNTNDYPELQGVIGSTYGSSVASKFKVPDLRGYVVVGVTSMGNNPPNPDFLKDANGAPLLYNLNAIYGESTHTLLENELAPHRHEIISSFYLPSGPVQVQQGSYGSTASVPIGAAMQKLNSVNNEIETALTPTGNARPFNIMQPSRALNYIIKY